MNRLRPSCKAARPGQLLGVASALVLGGIALALTFGYSSALAQQRPAAPAAGNAVNGKTGFTGQKCSVCHGDLGQGGSGTTAGPRIGPPRLELQQFIETVRNPKDPMPPYSTSDASDAQLGDIYAFLKTMTAPAQAAPITAPAGNIENGKRLFASAGCYECHDREGEGGQGSGPRLAPNPIGYAAFVHQCRQPSDQMPPYTAKVLPDSDLGDIYAFLQSIPKSPALSSIPLLQ